MYLFKLLGYIEMDLVLALSDDAKDLLNFPTDWTKETYQQQMGALQIIADKLSEVTDIDVQATHLLSRRCLLGQAGLQNVHGYGADEYPSLQDVIDRLVPVPGLAINKVPYETTRNPFKLWKRVVMRGTKIKFEKTGRQQSHDGNTQGVVRDIPPAKDLKPLSDQSNRSTLQKDTAYIVSGFDVGEVDTLVAYNGSLCVKKRMSEPDDDFFELVTQLYLYEEIQRMLVSENSRHMMYANICVPKLQFVQRAIPDSDKIDVCMTRAKGRALQWIAQKDRSNLFLALAYIMKALDNLQLDAHFMHRDLHAENVFFDKTDNTVTFIDFGMSCVNAKRCGTKWCRIAWANSNHFLYKDGKIANACSNKSLDVCTLITYLGDRAARSPAKTWCQQEVEKMKAAMVEVVNASDNEKAKQNINKKITDISARPWEPGNKLGERVQHQHHWVYEMAEFPLENWYPRKVLGRLLEHIPFEEWFGIRKHWSSAFNAITTKVPVTIVDSGRTGYVVGLHEYDLKVQVGSEISVMKPSNVRRR